jgi:transcriptional regulator with XRE-family HTH domain
MSRTETLGDRVRRLRTKAGLTQQELADKIGLSYPSINEIENGVTVKPRRGTLHKLCDFFNVSQAYLSSGHEAPAKQEPFIPTGKVNNMGATEVSEGEMEAYLGAKFGEDNGAPMTTGKPIKTKDDFIQSVLADANKALAEKKVLEKVVDEQRHTIRQLHKTNDFMQAQIESLQAQINALVGKQDGNHYHEAPGDFTIAAEPLNPIGFRVRMMYPDGPPQEESVVPMRIAV